MDYLCDSLIVTTVKDVICLMVLTFEECGDLTLIMTRRPECSKPESIENVVYRRLYWNYLYTYLLFLKSSQVFSWDEPLTDISCISHTNIFPFHRCIADQDEIATIWVSLQNPLSFSEPFLCEMSADDTLSSNDTSSFWGPHRWERMAYRFSSRWSSESRTCSNLKVSVFKKRMTTIEN